MIIYVVEAMSAQGYENTSWIVKAFDSEEKANSWIDEKHEEEELKAKPGTYCYIITEQVLE